MNQERNISSVKSVPITTDNKSIKEKRELKSTDSILKNDVKVSTEDQLKSISNYLKFDGKKLNNQACAQTPNKQQQQNANEQVVNYLLDNRHYLLQSQSQVTVRTSFKNHSNEGERSIKEEVKQQQKVTNTVVGADHDVGSDEKDVDCGYAWIILAVMFVINASTFGTARAYGLIFEKLAREHNNARTEAALPFTIMGAIENMGGPLTGYLLTKTNSWRLTVFIGSCLICLAHILAGFCTTLNSLILTIGLINGLGLSFITISSFQINNAYFVRYRSRAFGLGLTGAVFGTFYISPICQYILNNTSTTSECYLMLGLILLPNVPLSLLLKPKMNRKKSADHETHLTNTLCRTQKIATISDQVNQKKTQLIIKESSSSIWLNIIRVIQTPFFHLIWPTQLLFCWFNFVFGMIIVDFSKDRGLDCNHGAHLIPIWAFGQLTGRTLLGSFVDLKLVSYELFTVICFISISLSTWILNNVRPNNHQYQDILISLVVFILSMFISNLYILFNGLILKYMEKSLTPLSLGISSFTSSFFLLPRANVIGYYRDTIGNYDSMLTLFTYISLIAAIVWLLIPELFERNDNFNHYIYKRFEGYSLSSIMFSNIYKLPHNSNNLAKKSFCYPSQSGMRSSKQLTKIDGIGSKHDNKIVPVIKDLVPPSLLG